MRAKNPVYHQKICRECELPFESVTVRALDCSDCRVGRNSRWARRNHEKVRDNYLRKRYGITLDQYNRLLETQGGGCAICGITESDFGKYLSVDHDHRCCPGIFACGRCIRGLVCNPCNTNVLSKNTIETLQVAVAYLRKHDRKIKRRKP